MKKQHTGERSWAFGSSYEEFSRLTDHPGLVWGALQEDDPPELCSKVASIWTDWPESI